LVFLNSPLNKFIYGDTLPVISVEMKPVSPVVKSELITKLTKMTSEITHIPEESFIVFIKEYPPDAIGIGGVPLSHNLIKED